MKGYFEALEEQGYYLIAEIGVNYYDIAAKNGISLLDAAKLMIKRRKNAVLMLLNFNPIKQKNWQQRFLLLIGT